MICETVRGQMNDWLPIMTLAVLGQTSEFSCKINTDRWSEFRAERSF
jgi:hypothetical protein